MNINQMRHELVDLGGGAHALAIQILGNADDAADAVHDAVAMAYEAAKAAPSSVQEALSRVKNAAALQKLCRVPQAQLGRPPEGQW